MYVGVWQPSTGGLVEAGNMSSLYGFLWSQGRLAAKMLYKGDPMWVPVQEVKVSYHNMVI